MLLDENGLGDQKTDADRTQESGERSDDMDEKDHEIAHLSILARTTNPRNCAVHQQFAIDSFRSQRSTVLHSLAIRYRPCNNAFSFNEKLGARLVSCFVEAQEPKVSSRDLINHTMTLL